MDAGRIAEQLPAWRLNHGFPHCVRQNSERLANQLLGLVVPHFAVRALDSRAALVAEIESAAHTLRELARDLGHPTDDTTETEFFESLPGIATRLQQDAEAMADGDPAATGTDEVIAAYPGFLAIAVYRVAHELSRAGVPLIPRLLTEYAHRETGVDIHPDASIGSRFCIDHGTGIVIGQSAEIGNRVRIYQGVTLGALAVEKRLASQKRHPTIEDDVVIYANATILGGKTVIGHDSIVGGNAWITASVPPFSQVGNGSPARPRRNPDGPDLEFMI